MQIDFNNLTDAQREIIFRIGLMKIGESIFESITSVDKVQKNINLVKEKIGLTEDQIWECYEFLSSAVITLGKPKTRETIGFKKNDSQ